MRLAVLVLVSACWRSTPPPVPPPEPRPEPVASSSTLRSRPHANPCRRAIDSLVERLRPELAKSGLADTLIDEMVEAAVESCRATSWSLDLIDCYAATSDPNDLNACQPLMTADQTEDLTRRMMEIVQRMNSVPPPPVQGP